jgi:hypothetical protein
MTPRRPAEPDATLFVPLKPAWFHILLTLSEQPTHGYAIRQAVEKRTDGQLRLWPATLYGSIGEMEDAGLIEQSGASEDVSFFLNEVPGLSIWASCRATRTFPKPRQTTVRAERS